MIIYLDENLPPSLARGLHELQKHRNTDPDKIIEVKTLAEVYGKGTKDVDWLPSAGKESACVLTNDKHIMRRPHEKSIFESHAVGLFIIETPGKKSQLKFWELIQLIITHWEEICKIALKENKPFVYSVRPKSKVKPLR